MTYDTIKFNRNLHKYEMQTIFFGQYLINLFKTIKIFIVSNFQQLKLIKIQRTVEYKRKNSIYIIIYWLNKITVNEYKLINKYKYFVTIPLN